MTDNTNISNLINNFKLNYDTINHKGKFFAVMLFETEINLNISSIPNKWININNHIFTNGTDALNYYANTPNPASQIIDASSIDELHSNMLQMIDNYNNPTWLNENLYPFL